MNCGTGRSTAGSKPIDRAIARKKAAAGPRVSLVARANGPGRGGGEITMGARDEVVVVFGGSSGIGEAVARAMVARGSRIVIAGRDPGRLAAAAGRLDGAVQTAMVDACDRDAVDAFFAGVAQAVDHLVLLSVPNTPSVPVDQLTGGAVILAAMIMGHVPAVRLSAGDAAGRVVVAVPARGVVEGRGDLAAASPAHSSATPDPSAAEAVLGGPGASCGAARDDPARPA